MSTLENRVLQELCVELETQRLSLTSELRLGSKPLTTPENEVDRNAEGNRNNGDNARSLLCRQALKHSESRMGETSSDEEGRNEECGEGRSGNIWVSIYSMLALISGLGWGSE